MLGLELVRVEQVMDSHCVDTLSFGTTKGDVEIRFTVNNLKHTTRIYFGKESLCI